MIRHLPRPKEQDWRAVLTQLSDHSDKHYQSRACGQPSSGIPSYAGRVELTSHVATCGDRCTEWLHLVLSAPCSTEAKPGSVDVAQQAWSAVGRLRGGLTDARLGGHAHALADACTASTWLQRARSAPGCLGLLTRMHTVHARYRRRSLSANGAAEWAAARGPSIERPARKVLYVRRLHLADATC